MAESKPPVPLDPRGLPQGYNFREEWEVTPREVKAMLDRGDDFLLVDCRLPREFEVAKIDGATLMPLQQLQTHLAELEEHADKPIVVHCHHGGRSFQMTAVLRQMGFKDVKSMAGGIDVWSMDVDPKVPRY